MFHININRRTGLMSWLLPAIISSVAAPGIIICVHVIYAVAALDTLGTRFELPGITDFWENAIIVLSCAAALWIFWVLKKRYFSAKRIHV